RVASALRVGMTGNEDWLVPASADERRYAVLDVAPGNQQDKRFFRSLAQQLEDGGYEALFDYLAAVDLTAVDVTTAPETDALREQKEESLGLVEAWVLESLREGVLAGTGVAWDDVMTVGCQLVYGG